MIFNGEASSAAKTLPLTQGRRIVVESLLLGNGAQISDRNTDNPRPHAHTVPAYAG